MLKIYKYKGKTWQFEEGEQPEGFVEVGKKKAVEPPKKAVKPAANKARKAVKTK